jgi:hypothetical protein
VPVKDCGRPIISPLIMPRLHFCDRIANIGFAYAAATVALAILQRRSFGTRSFGTRSFGEFRDRGVSRGVSGQGVSGVSGEFRDRRNNPQMYVTVLLETA